MPFNLSIFWCMADSFNHDWLIKPCLPLIFRLSFGKRVKMTLIVGQACVMVMVNFPG